MSNSNSNSNSNSTVERDPFPITAAQLSGNFCETLFFGIYLVTCTFCIRTLLTIGTGTGKERWRQPHEIRWMLTIVAFILFVICTFDTVLGLLHNFRAFVDSEDPEQEFRNIADWINIARSVNQTIAMIIGDFVLIYRCWVVHGRRWRVITPSLMLYLGNLAMATKLIEVEANPRTDRDITLNSRQIQPWWLSFFAITAVQNTLTTSILVWRIWKVERQSERFMTSVVYRPRRLQKVMRVIAESGAAYTACVLVTFIVSATRSNAMYPTADMTLVATGIAYNVILVRSSASRDQQFITFDHNGQIDTTHPTGTSSSIVFRRQEVELTDIKSEHRGDERSSRDDLYPTGVTVTTNVVKR